MADLQQRSKDVLEFLKQLAEVLKAWLIGGGLLVVLLFPDCASRQLSAYNISEVEVAGVKMSRKAVATALETANDELPKAKSELAQASADLDALQDRYDAAVEALRLAQAALDAGRPVPKSLSRSPASEDEDADKKAAPVAVAAAQVPSIARAIKEHDDSKQEVVARKAELEHAVKEAEAVVTQLQLAPALPRRMALVLGESDTLAGAKKILEATRASGTAAIYLRQGKYRPTVSALATPVLPNNKLPAAPVRRPPGSYQVNLSSWCPKATSAGEYLDCGF